MEKALIISHVVAGVITLISGLLAAFIGKKGGKLHRQVGTAFYWSMWWIFLSTLLIIGFVRFNAFLMVIAVFSWYMSFSGVRALRMKTTRKAQAIDWAAGGLTFLAGLAFVGMGIYYGVQSNWSAVVGYLSLFFGIFTTQIAFVDLRSFSKLDKANKMWWWFAHIKGMSGALIASITAFMVQNGQIFKLPSEMMWMPWVVPTLIGAPLIAYTMNKYRKQFKVGKYALHKNN